MATTMTVLTDQWNELFGVWFYVHPDPLTDTGRIAVTVHWDLAGHLWLRTKGPCAGVDVQTVAPDPIQPS